MKARGKNYPTLVAINRQPAQPALLDVGLAGFAAAFNLLVHRKVELAYASRFLRLERVHEGDEVIERQRGGKLLLAGERAVYEIEKTAAQADRCVLRIARACLEPFNGIDGFSGSHG